MIVKNGQEPYSCSWLWLWLLIPQHNSNFVGFFGPFVALQVDFSVKNFKFVLISTFFRMLQDRSCPSKYGNRVLINVCKMVPICLGPVGRLFFSILLAIGQFSRRGQISWKLMRGGLLQVQAMNWLKRGALFQNRNNLLHL